MPSTEANQLKPILVVVGVVQHPLTKKILITKRTEKQHLAGLWEFPGGKVELGEGLFQALQRELIEEVGITINAAHPLKQITHHYSEQSVCLNFWMISAFKGEATSKENQKLEWVDIDQLHKFEFPEANKPIIESLPLATCWMITPDCELEKLDEFVDALSYSIKKHHITMVLFRSKLLNDQDYYLIYERLKPYLKTLRCRLILNREAINEEICDHWHLTSKQLYLYKARPINKGILSASCHTIEDIRQAEKLDINFILLSAVKKTSSHPEGGILGWSQFKKMAYQTVIPIYALGGVDRDDMTLAQYHGAIGIAGISTFL